MFQQRLGRAGDAGRYAFSFRCEDMSNSFTWVIMLGVCMLVTSGPPVTVAQEGRPVARKLDEFRPDTGGETLKIHCDNFAYYLMEEPGARGYIIFYPKRGRRPYHYHSAALSYLTVRRGDIPNKIEAVLGGYRDRNSMELWIVPEGAEPPKVAPPYTPRKRSKRRAPSRKHA
jgi:hypothetical protein